MNKPDLRDPADLRPHSILHHIPSPAKDAPEVCACADTIRELDGHLLPLVIDETGHLLTDDSRLRWMAARRLGLATVPVVVQSAELAPVIALNALVHRAHYTKGAIAFLAVDMLKSAFDAGRSIRLRNLRNLKESSNVVSDDIRAATVEALAEKLGIHRDLLSKAREVHKKFAADRKKYPFTIEGGERDGERALLTLEEYFLPRIFRQATGGEHESARPMGLGAVIAGIAGVQNTKGTVKHTATQLDLFKGGLDALSKRLTYWNELDADQKREAEPKLDAFFDAMDDSLLELSYEKIKRRMKAREIN